MLHRGLNSRIIVSMGRERMLMTSDEEMEEINRFHRIIGHCEQELAKL